MDLGGQLHATSAAAHWVGPQTRSGRFGKEESLETKYPAFRPSCCLSYMSIASSTASPPESAI
jgi:hypothetical protein